MTADMRARAGLGSPPDMYRQQGNESINNVVKKDMAKKMTLVQFIHNIRHLVEQQQNEAKMAIYGRGVYKMKEEYRAYAGGDHTSISSGVRRYTVWRRFLKMSKDCDNIDNRRTQMMDFLEAKEQERT